MVGGGLIQVVPRLELLTIVEQPSPRCVAYVNEDGKQRGFSPNILATRMWYQALGMENALTASRAELIAAYNDTFQDGLNGPMVVLTGDDAFMAALRGDDAFDEEA